MKGCILKEAGTRSRKNSPRWFVENNWKELLEERLLLVIYDSTMERRFLVACRMNRRLNLYVSSMVLIFKFRNLLYVSSLSVGCNYKTFEKFLPAKTDVSSSFVTFRPLCLVLIEFLLFNFKHYYNITYLNIYIFLIK